MKTIFSIVILIFLSEGIYAQGQCSNSIYEANKQFETGNFDNSVKILLPCLKSGFNAEERFEGYRLLAKDYIYLNKQAEADTAVMKMLKQKPSYKLFPDPKDPVALSNVIRSFNVLPQLCIGGDFGVNITNVNLISNHQVANTTGAYISQLRYQLGLNLDYNLWKNLHLCAGFQYLNAAYEHDFDSVAGLSQKYVEELSYYSIPVTAKYYLFKNKEIIRPWAEVGVSFDFLAGDYANITNHDISNGNTESASINPTSRRNQTNLSILYGVGINYRVFSGWITAGVRYVYGQSEIVNSSQRYNDLNFVFNYQYVDDDFKFNKWIFSVGYTLPLFYKVEKTKNKAY